MREAAMKSILYYILLLTLWVFFLLIGVKDA